MKKWLLLLVWLIVSISFTQAQFLKKSKQVIEEDSDGDPLNRRKAEKPMADLSIGGDESVTMDSSFEFDVAVYQETVAYQGSGNQEVIDGGEQIVIYYSNIAPQ